MSAPCCRAGGRRSTSLVPTVALHLSRMSQSPRIEILDWWRTHVRRAREASAPNDRITRCDQCCIDSELASWIPDQGVAWERSAHPRHRRPRESSVVARAAPWPSRTNGNRAHPRSRKLRLGPRVALQSARECASPS
jgi:hypothetical protein